MTEAFHHEALLYADDDEFVAGTMPLIEEALSASAPVMVATSAEKIALLRGNLDGRADAVRFADMQQLGVNPGAIISSWREFVAGRRPGQPVWGIGEPVWAGRTPAELAECHRHECLLNLAFADTAGFRLLCPYDTSALEPAILERAAMSHPVIIRGGTPEPSDRYRGLRGFEEMLAEPLPEPPIPPLELPFDADTLPSLRRFVLDTGRGAGLGAKLADDLVLAVNELATNSVRHAHGTGTLRLWRDGELLVLEVRDRGRIVDPLVGRQRPPRDDEGGYGLWMVNHLCELVQVRSSPEGTVVRLHVRIASEAA